VSLPLSRARVGIYVDGAWVSVSGGHGLRYDVLREFAMRDGADPARMNLYVGYDAERARDDGAYRRGQDNFCGVLRDFGYKVHQKEIHPATDEAGAGYQRSGTDLALAVDVLRQGGRLDRVLLVAGAPELADVTRELQNRGCRVEVVGFEDTPPALRAEADLFVPALLIPNLLPIAGQNDREAWGRVGGKARGMCYNHSGKGYGFLRYLQAVGPAIWITDSRHPDSPFETVFFHDSQLPRNVAFHELPSRSHIFEFELIESDRFEDDVQAINLKLVTGPERRAEGVDEGNGRGGERRDEVYGAEFGEE
jgi:uncharacterized LabA/DUF88 family protein